MNDDAGIRPVPAVCQSCRSPSGMDTPFFEVREMKRCCAAVIMMAVVSPVMAGNDNPLVGRWDYPLNDHYYMRFFANGTFRQVTLAGMQEGRYRVLDGKVVEISLVTRVGRINERVTNEIKYRFNQGYLELKLEGRWCTFKRSDSSNK